MTQRADFDDDRRGRAGGHVRVEHQDDRRLVLGVRSPTHQQDREGHRRARQVDRDEVGLHQEGLERRHQLDAHLLGALFRNVGIERDDAHPERGTALRDERYEVLGLKPEMASFDSGSVNFGDRIFEGDLPFLRRMILNMDPPEQVRLRRIVTCRESGRRIDAE